MKIWYNTVIESERHLVEVAGNRIRIGRGEENEVVLDSPYIAEQAAVLYRRQGVWELVALGMNGVQVGDRQLSKGETCQILTNQAISLFPFSLSLDLPQQAEISAERHRKELDDQVSALVGEVHLQLLQKMNLGVDVDVVQSENDTYLLTLEQNLDSITKDCLSRQKGQKELVQHLAAHGTRGEILSRLMVQSGQSTESVLQSERHWSRLVSAVPDRERELDSAVDYLNQQWNTAEAKSLSERIARVEDGFWQAWKSLGDKLHPEFVRYVAHRYLKTEVKDIIFGYGPLEDLLRLPTISEIMVVDRQHIYVERDGRLENSGRRFISDAVIEAIIQRIVAKVGRRIDKSQPLVDARLSDGSRVNAVIPPLAVSGPCLTVRKFPYRKMLIDDLIGMGALTPTVADFLRAIVLGRRNVVISGGTGTGKTTMLNCLSDFIPDKERIVTIEDTAELQLAKEHVVKLETKDANVEGTGAYTIRDLVRNALRMRPDRIIVGECRGPEALDMLQAMNTGHDGSLTTIHANSSKDVVLRLEVLVQMAADLPVDSIRQQVAAAVDVIVQLQRMRDGRRCISQVTEVTGVNRQTGNLELRDLYRLADHDSQAQLQPTGRLPTFMGELIDAKTLDLESFY